MVLWELLVVLLLIAFNGVFAMSELAIVSARRARLQVLASEGRRGAETALALAADPGRFLSTVQIGITLIGIFAGAYGGAALAGPLADYLARWPTLAQWAHPLALGIVVVGITYLSLIVGELVPKQLALRDPERVAVVIAPPMHTLSRLTAPLVALLDVSTRLGLRLCGASERSESRVTDEEIHTLIAEATESGVVERSEQAMIRGVMRLADRPVGALLTPRTDIVWLDIEASPEETAALLRASPYSRYPVCNGTVDDVLGVVQAKDLLDAAFAGRAPDLRGLIREPAVVPDSCDALRLLEQLRTSALPMALVVDEYGDLCGLVTATDILEAIVGELAEADGSFDPQVVTREDGSWLLDGRLPADELKELLSVATLPGDGEFNTLAGFVMTTLDTMPTVGDHFDAVGFRFEVVDIDGRRIDKLLVSRL